jgi:hypothetical protein
MTSPAQPQKIILNSKFKNNNETIDNITYNFETSINNAIGARVSSFSTVYLAKLIQQGQGSLKFAIRTNTETFEYDIDITPLSNVYYHTQKDLFDKLNVYFENAIFTDTDPASQYRTTLLPIFNFDQDKLRTYMTIVNQNAQILITSDNSTFWFKLGYPNGEYPLSFSNYSPNPPSVIPLNELYIQIDGLINESAIVRTINNNNPANSSSTCEIITFNNVSLGDIFLYRGNTIPEYPLNVAPYINSLNIRLLNSIGQPATLESDYRLVIDLIY